MSAAAPNEAPPDTNAGASECSWDATPAVRFGVAYQWFQQEYADGVVATNHRGWFSALLLF